MATQPRTVDQNFENRNGTFEGAAEEIPDQESNELAMEKALREGIGSIAGAARFAIAVSLDLMKSRIAVPEAAIHVRTANIQLKAAELHLKHGRKACKKLFVDQEGLQ